MPFKYVFILFSYCILQSSTLFCQNELYKIDQDSSSTWTLFKYDVNTTWQGVKYSFTKPLNWKGKDFAKLGGLIIGTATLSLADEEGRRFFNRQQEDFPNLVRDFGWYFGSPQNYFMANAGIYGFGLLTKNEKVRRTSVLIITSSITSGFIQTIAKNGLGRARPGTGLGPYYFKPFSKEAGHHAFPSGHTILSVTMSHAIAKQFNNTWAKIGIYTVGAIPPISRLIDGAHWLTDVAFSTALSIIVVNSVDKFLFKNESHGISSPKLNKRITWNMSFGANKIGLIGTF